MSVYKIAVFFILFRIATVITNAMNVFPLTQNVSSVSPTFIASFLQVLGFSSEIAWFIQGIEWVSYVAVVWLVTRKQK